MSVYRPKASPFYQFDFQLEGHRFHGSTKCTTEREAKAVERAERERARAFVKAARSSSTSLKLDDIGNRYLDEVGQYHAGSDTTERDVARIVDHLSADKLITEITDDDVAKLVAWRRGHRVKGRKHAPLISPSTVNRSTTEVLKKLFTFAKRRNVRFEHEPEWKTHFLKEPEERVRELHLEEADCLDAAVRADWKPFVEFANESGLRLRECVTLRWAQVNWSAGQIVRLGKGGKRVTKQLTPTLRAILEPLQGHHPEFVFTYVAHRTHSARVKGGARTKGQRYPVTLNGAKSAWKRFRKAAAKEVASFADFRFHDLRHDFATRLLRESGNLKLVQRALNHADVRMTTRYAHVLDNEVAEAMERAAEARREFRNKSRSALRKAS
jgi:integrase